MPPSTIRGLVPRRPCCHPSLPTMAPSLPPTSPSRTTPSYPTLQTTQLRHTTYVARPRRPYQFTQLIHLSDGSTFTVRTTSPAPVYKSVTDTRNHILWQPSEKSLQNIEHDEAGKLAAFRERYGRGFDLEKTKEEIEADAERRRVLALEAKVRREQMMRGKNGAGGEEAVGGVAEVEEVIEEEEEEDGGFDALSDLISGYADMMAPVEKKKVEVAPAPVPEVKKGKGKGKGKK